MWPHHPQRRVRATRAPKRRRDAELGELAVALATAPAHERTGGRGGGAERRRWGGAELDELVAERFLFLVFFFLTGKMPSVARSSWQN